MLWSLYGCILIPKGRRDKSRSIKVQTRNYSITRSASTCRWGGDEFVSLLKLRHNLRF